MSKIDNGGPAFPQTNTNYYGGETSVDVTGGMSLRDWFAGQALAGLVVLCSHDTLRDGMTYEQHVARNSYRVADAMLAARREDRE